MQILPWIIALAAVALLASMSTALLLRTRRRPSQPPPLPVEWALSPRPVFSSDERRVYRLLREALPHHAVLAKLPLIRFCQANDPEQTRSWYELLGTLNVTFVVCSANGRVLAAIDLDTERGSSRRAMQIKQSVLGACRVRYLRCPVDNLPTIAELQLLVPQSGLAARGPLATPQPLSQARDTLTSTVANRRAQRNALWQDSTNFQDSFFAPGNRLDSFADSDFDPAPRGGARRDDPPSAGFVPREDIAGVVIEETGEFVTRH
ncbi:MAG TPA: DUF2726 domain-containing protein [Burkholderiaceae bacterium]|nr:DUF2726 domain-containing protein [Burkholderiaceae bacterium]